MDGFAAFAAIACVGIGLMLLVGGTVLCWWLLARGRRRKPKRKRKKTRIVVPTWPANIPRLYPDLDGVALCEFMTAEQVEAIKKFPILTVLPFVSEDASEDDAAFGRGLQLLMIRDLMLVRNISVHGPEDTPQVDYETARELAEKDERSIYVTGSASCGESGFRLDLAVRQPGRKWAKGTINEQQFGKFLHKCAATIAKAVGGHVDQDVTAMWQVARPSSAESLTRFGWICLTYDEDPEDQVPALLQLSQHDPAFGLPAASVDEDFPGALPHLLEGLRRDPYNAQLCFGLFCAVWQSSGWEPAAMQFARRAIELSPGHGKAHMCAPHAAHPEARMLAHSELGYHLLPGNTFAVNNYVVNLERAGTRPDELVRLAKEGVSNDPQDPGNYERLIELYCDSQQYGAALVVAEKLQSLFEPAIGERTLYCLKQNPRMAEWIESGQYDPAAENRRRITQLRQRSAGS